MGEAENNPLNPSTQFCLYRHFDANGVLLYVGLTTNLLLRLSQHSTHSKWFGQITTITIERFPSMEVLIDAENEAITKENPIFNLRRPVLSFPSQSRLPPKERIVWYYDGDKPIKQVPWKEFDRLQVPFDTARTLKIDNEFLNETRHTNKAPFPFYRCGNSVRFKDADVKQWLDARNSTALLANRNL